MGSILLTPKLYFLQFWQSVLCSFVFGGWYECSWQYILRLEWFTWVASEVNVGARLASLCLGVGSNSFEARFFGFFPSCGASFVRPNSNKRPNNARLSRRNKRNWAGPFPLLCYCPSFYAFLYLFPHFTMPEASTAETEQVSFSEWRVCPDNKEGFDRFRNDNLPTERYSPALRRALSLQVRQSRVLSFR